MKKFNFFKKIAFLFVILLIGYWDIKIKESETSKLAQKQELYVSPVVHFVAELQKKLR